MKPTPLLSLGLTLLMSSWLVACSKSREPSVWETYDIRYPVPAASAVPVSRATIYNRYNSDNDAYYTKPRGSSFGSCSLEDLDEFSCD